MVALCAVVLDVLVGPRQRANPLAEGHLLPEGFYQKALGTLESFAPGRLQVGILRSSSSFLD
jgi:hypothetical protein